MYRPCGALLRSPQLSDHFCIVSDPTIQIYSSQYMYVHTYNMSCLRAYDNSRTQDKIRSKLTN